MRKGGRKGKRRKGGENRGRKGRRKQIIQEAEEKYFLNTYAIIM